MKLTRFQQTIGLTITQNAGDYTNIKPTHDILLEGEDLKDLDELQELTYHQYRQVANTVHEQIDSELEWRDKTPIYAENIFSVIRCKAENFFAMIIGGVIPDLWDCPHGFQAHRYEYLIKKLKQTFPDVAATIAITAVDALPVLEEFTAILVRGKYLLLLAGRYDYCHDLPEGLPEGWRQGRNFTRVMTRAGFLREMEALAAKEGWQVRNAVNGDYTSLPPLPAQTDEIPFEDDADDDEDDPWEGLYNAIFEDDPLPDALTQADVHLALQKILEHLQTDWLSASEVLKHLAIIKSLAERYYAMEVIENILAELGEDTLDELAAKEKEQANEKNGSAA